MPRNGHFKNLEKFEVFYGITAYGEQNSSVLFQTILRT